MNEWFIRYCSTAAGLYIMSSKEYRNILKKWHAIPNVHVNSRSLMKTAKVHTVTRVLHYVCYLQ